MFIIGVDPHRGSHVAVVLDDHEQIHDELAVTANRLQRQRLLDWASRYQPRVWAIEGAAGTGALLAQQLVAAGEQVIDVPPALAARVRLLDNEQRSKTDRHDARSVAVAAQRKRGLRHVTVEDHVGGAAPVGETSSRLGRRPHARGVPTPQHPVLPGRRPLPQAPARRPSSRHPGSHPPRQRDRPAPQARRPRTPRRGAPLRHRDSPSSNTASAAPSTPPARASPPCTASGRSWPPT